MQRVCTRCSTDFEVTPEDTAFYDRVSPTIAGRKHAIPPPTLCPDCRQKRRLAFRNERHLYHRPSCVSGKDVISVYAPGTPYRVSSLEEWQNVDNEVEGREFDFSRPFFAQFAELQARTVKAPLSQNGVMLNSEYSHFTGWLKNCYMAFDVGKSEDCLYCEIMTYSKDSVDLYNSPRCELCYECVDCLDCYDLRWSGFCKNCVGSAFLADCIGCKSCIGCANLRNKEYWAFNEPVGKEGYEKLRAAYLSGSQSGLEALRTKWREFLLTQPRRASHLVNCHDSTGDYLIGCENAKDCYDCIEAKDVRYCQNVIYNSTDCYDVSTFGEQMSFCYEVTASGGILKKSAISNVYFSSYVLYGGNNIFYSIDIHENGQDLFGCCDVRRKRYCILNKQYTREEYEALAPKIIAHMRSTGEWGEFFPPALSPFGYDESLAQEYFPMTREEAAAGEYRWSGYEPPAPTAHRSVPAGRLPDGIADVPDDILQWAIVCEETGKPFRLIERELEFYRRMHLPVPRRHPNQRHLDRHRQRNPRRLWARACAKCTKAIRTTYAPDRPETVYCEECYQEAVQ
jgi:hypothetical protein